MVRHLAFLLAVLAWSISPASAQLPDQTTLTGVYNVRFLGVNTQTTNTPVSFQGTMTFDGKGGFTVSGGQGITAGAALKFQTTGQYTVLSSGLVLIDNPFDPTAANGTVIYGGVGGNGVIVGSSTDSLFYCDLFVAVPAATSGSAATLSGNYRVAGMEFLNGDVTATRNTFFAMTADGSGALGNVTVNGTAQSLKSAATTQTSNGVTYTLTANGSGTLVFPAPSGVTGPNTLISGSKVLYAAKDGSFFVAGSATGYDMEIGVKTGGTTKLDGLYWNAFLNNYVAGTQSDGVYSGQGASNENASSGLEIGHQRWQPDLFTAYDFTFSGSFPFGSDFTTGTTYSTEQYAIGAGGSMVVGAGIGTNYWLSIYVKAPAMSAPAATTVFLNPQGVGNAANSVPLTAQFTPGEYITLVGSGLGPTSLVAASAPLPTTLSNVQVLINNTAAPIYYVSAGQIAVVIPNSAPSDGNFITIQVVNGGVQSNKVSVYSGATSPGMFTIPPGGPFSGAIVHATTDGSVVTTSNPAKIGETVAVYMTGLGAVTGNVAAGAIAPSSPLSTLVGCTAAANSCPISILIDGVQANVLFAGLAPGFANLYQVNVTIPAGVTKGNAIVVEIVTQDTDNIEGTVPIG